MRMLFEDIAEKHSSKERIRKYKAWIENANKARESRSLRFRDNQYDKAEELITFYTFAPLELREDKREVVQQILSLGGIMQPVEEPLALAFEKQLEPLFTDSTMRKLKLQWVRFFLTEMRRLIWKNSKRKE